MANLISRVHAIFKTHLDIGFTDRACRAVESVGYRAADARFSVTSLDSPLICFGERKLLRFDRSFVLEFGENEEADA